MKNILILLFTFLPILSNAQNWMWARGASGSTNNYLTSSVVDGAGNVYTAGTFYTPTITFGTYILTRLSSGNQRDIFVVKYAPDGAVIWCKNFINAGSNISAA